MQHRDLGHPPTVRRKNTDRRTTTPKPVTFENLSPEVIRTENRMRGLDEKAVERLVESIARIGLQTPLSVRWCPDDVTDYSADLIAGRHRLEACKRLGHQLVPVAVHDGDENDARLWEIAENLDRAELTALERDSHVAEWVRLTEAKVAQSAPPSGGKQPKEQGIRAAARELGIERTAVQRAVKVNSLAPDAKAEAVALGLDGNRSALLEAASHKSNEGQVLSLRERSARDAEKARERAALAEQQRAGGTINPLQTLIQRAGQRASGVASAEARQAADMLADSVDAESLAGLGQWLVAGSDHGRQLGTALLKGLPARFSNTEAHSSRDMGAQ